MNQGIIFDVVFAENGDTLSPIRYATRSSMDLIDRCVRCEDFEMSDVRATFRVGVEDVTYTLCTVRMPAEMLALVTDIPALRLEYNQTYKLKFRITEQYCNK